MAPSPKRTCSPPKPMTTKECAINALCLARDVHEMLVRHKEKASRKERRMLTLIVALFLAVFGEAYCIYILITRLYP